MSLEVGSQTLCRIELVKFSGQSVISFTNGHVKWDITLKCIFAEEI